MTGKKREWLIKNMIKIPQKNLKDYYNLYKLI